jgi:hypothetical protein
MKRAAQDDVCGGCGGIFKWMSKHHAARPRCLKMTVYKDDAGGEKEATMLDASEVEDITFQANIKATVLRDLSDFRLGRNSQSVHGSAVDGFKDCVTSWLALCDASLVAALRPHISPSSGIDVAELVRSRLDVFNGIKTAKLEQRALIHSSLGPRWVAPRRRMMPGSESDCVWDIPLISQLQALISSDPSAAAQIISSSEAWSSDAFGELQPSSPRTWSDITDGDVFRDHPQLGATSGAAPCEISGSGVKTAWKVYYDDVEVANPIGVARGVHSIGAIYVSLINLDPATRNRLEYTFVATLALTSVIKTYGMLGVLAGAHLDGSLDDQAEFSVGGQMRKLDAGVKLLYPAIGIFGGEIERTTYGWSLMACADFPAAAKMLGTSGSTSSNMPCRQCDWDKTSKVCWAPSSFLKRPRIRCRWNMRNLDSASSAIEEAQMETSMARKAAVLRESGMYAERYAFHPTYFPHLKEPFASLPQDGMHLLFSSGLVTFVAAEMLYLFISVHKDFTVDELNQRIGSYDWPEGAIISLVLRLAIISIPILIILILIHSH